MHLHGRRARQTGRRCPANEDAREGGLRILLANGGAAMPGRGHVYSLARLQMSRLQLCIVRVFIIHKWKLRTLHGH